jgi:hypothetical protein
MELPLATTLQAFDVRVTSHSLSRYREGAELQLADLTAPAQAVQRRNIRQPL